jgi:hypothetical protein
MNYELSAMSLTPVVPSLSSFQAFRVGRSLPGL